jgi:Mg-chelatase subunit ChlD
VTFADEPNLVQDFTESAEDIRSELVFVTPKGRTSLLDAMALAVNAGRMEKRLRITAQSAESSC